MSHDILGIIWYLLLAILWTGFVALESFSSGVGMIFRTARSEAEGRVLQYSAGPYWDGSQVWLITAGGATFAAFPAAFASIFSNLYVALYLLVMMLILRGVAMELVYKDANPRWQLFMGRAWMVAGYLVALLLGVRFTNLFLAAGTAPEPVNSFWALLSKAGLLGGLLFVAQYRTAGILWAKAKAQGDVVDRLAPQALLTALAAALITPLLMMAFNWDTNLFATHFRSLPVLWLLPIATMALPVGTVVLLWKRQFSGALACVLAGLVLFMATGYAGTYPYLTAGITVIDARASELTLTIMTGVAAVFVPLVLGYQGWKFARFRRKIDTSYFDL